MTSTDRLLAGVIAAPLAPAARLYEMNAAFGVVIVCVAFATTMEVIITTTVATRMTPGRENFWIRIVIAFILFGFLLGFGFLCDGSEHCSCVVLNGRDCLALSAAGASFFCFSRGVVKAAQGRGPDS